MNLGGQELRILLEMEQLAGRGFESLLAAMPGSRILGKARSMGFTAYPVKMRGSFDPAAVSGFMRLIKSEKVDIINAHGSKDGWSAGVAARLLGRKVVRSRHVANPVRAHVFGRVVYGALCDRIITTSDSIKAGMAARGVPADKIIPVPTGVDISKFNPAVRKGGFRAGLGIGAEVPLVGMVAVLRGDKGPDIFVKAAELALAYRPDVVFALVGDGWKKSELDDMVRASGLDTRILLTGRREDIPSVMADLDALVLPARAPEGVPQVVLQAHAMKLPVIASDVGGINEVAVDMETALTVPPGEPGPLADAILRILGDKELGASLAEAGYRLVMEKYTLNIMLDRMEAVYRSLA